MTASTVTVEQACGGDWRAGPIELGMTGEVPLASGSCRLSKMTEDDVATIGGLLTFLASRDMLTILLSMAGDDVVGRLLLVASRARLTDAVHDSLQEALYWLGQWHTFENARRARMVRDRWLRRQRRRRGRRAPPLWRHLVSSDSETMEYWPTGSWSEDETSHTDDL